MFSIPADTGSTLPATLLRLTLEASSPSGAAFSAAFISASKRSSVALIKFGTRAPASSAFVVFFILLASAPFLAACGVALALGFALPIASSKLTSARISWKSFEVCCPTKSLISCAVSKSKPSIGPLAVPPMMLFSIMFSIMSPASFAVDGSGKTFADFATDSTNVFKAALTSSNPSILASVSGSVTPLSSFDVGTLLSTPRPFTKEFFAAIKRIIPTIARVAPSMVP